MFGLAGKGIGVLALGCLVAMPAFAEEINFAGDASDNDAPLSALSGRIEYSFSGSTLQLTFWNDTADYTLVIAGWNVSSDVTGISIIPDAAGTDPNNDAENYALSLSQPNGGQGGFGNFDWMLDFGQGNNGIAAGQSATFSFAVTGNSLDISDFFDHASIRGQEETGVAILHYARGPNGDSAWVIPGGGVVPEPMTAAMMGIGAALLAAQRARRKA